MLVNALLVVLWLNIHIFDDLSLLGNLVHNRGVNHLTHQRLRIKLHQLSWVRRDALRLRGTPLLLCL